MIISFKVSWKQYWLEGAIILVSICKIGEMWYDNLQASHFLSGHLINRLTWWLHHKYLWLDDMSWSFCQWNLLLYFIDLLSNYINAFIVSFHYLIIPRPVYDVLSIYARLNESSAIPCYNYQNLPMLRKYVRNNFVIYVNWPSSFWVASQFFTHDFSAHQNVEIYKPICSEQYNFDYS